MLKVHEEISEGYQSKRNANCTDKPNVKFNSQDLRYGLSYRPFLIAHLPA